MFTPTNDALKRVAATYCAHHKALAGEPCFNGPTLEPRGTFTGFCAARIRSVTAEADAAHAYAREIARERSRRRNKAA